MLKRMIAQPKKLANLPYTRGLPPGNPACAGRCTIHGENREVAGVQKGGGIVTRLGYCHQESGQMASGSRERSGHVR